MDLNDEPFFPSKGRWQRRDPGDAGFKPESLSEAVRFAESKEIGWSHDLTRYLPSGSRHPFDRVLGPIKDRSAPAGLVIRHGYIVAEYGDPSSNEVTFSATKSYISAVAGLALDRGLIRSIDDRVSEYISDGGFDSDHNSRITWRHLLQQTSEWEGELFGIPDSIDRGRVVGSRSAMVAEANDYDRRLRLPGSFWEYNDVRVNRTALSLLRLFGEPLPVLLKRELMDPIGASDDWIWHGYENSWVEVNRGRIQSVSGGAHWGGGLWISSFDHARFGLLFLRRGRWRDRQILSEAWVEAMTEPCPIKPEYGFLWWLNHDKSISSRSSPGSFAARGAGGNIVFIERLLDLVIVLRWCADPKVVIDQIVESLEG
jgi:CubicO group peptidase (beta-lactamase class C family)